VSGLKSEQVIDVAFEPVGAQEPGGQKDAPALPDAPITPDRDSAGVDDQHVTL
jgi:hypothetical protein